MTFGGGRVMVNFLGLVVSLLAWKNLLAFHHWSQYFSTEGGSYESDMLFGLHLVLMASLSGSSSDYYFFLSMYEACFLVLVSLGAYLLTRSLNISSC